MRRMPFQYKDYLQAGTATSKRVRAYPKQLEGVTAFA